MTLMYVSKHLAYDLYSDSKTDGRSPLSQQLRTHFIDQPERHIPSKARRCSLQRL